MIKTYCDRCKKMIKERDVKPVIFEYDDCAQDGYYAEIRHIRMTRLNPDDMKPYPVTRYIDLCDKCRKALHCIVNDFMDVSKQ